LEVTNTGPFQQKEIADTILAQIIFAFCSEVNGKTKTMVFVVNNSVSKTSEQETGVRKNSQCRERTWPGHPKFIICFELVWVGLICGC